MVDKSFLFSGSNWSDIFCYASQYTNNWAYEGFLLSLFIIMVVYGFRRQEESSLIFIASSTIIFSLATIFLIGSNEVGCNLISEQSYIIVVILFVGSVINYLYNKPENV